MVVEQEIWTLHFQGIQALPLKALLVWWHGLHGFSWDYLRALMILLPENE